MNIDLLSAFFMWCTVIDGSILILWTGLFFFASDWVFNLHKQWFPITRENFDVLMYAFLGLFKLFWFGFNLVPFIALSIIT